MIGGSSKGSAVVTNMSTDGSSGTLYQSYEHESIMLDTWPGKEIVIKIYRWRTAKYKL